MATTKSLAKSARDILEKNRRDAHRLANEKGVEEVRRMLARAQRELEARIRAAVERTGEGSFTVAQMRATLDQVKHVTLQLVPAMRGALVATGKEAAETAADNVTQHLAALDRQFRGIGVQPLAINEARMVDVAVRGSEASLLRRIGTDPEHPAKVGVLQRYGVETVGKFEKELQQGLLQKKSFAEIQASIVAQSPFLQGAPAHWAERIVRTETMAAYNGAAHEATKEADKQLGDVVKILSAQFDDRTASDSYAVHGQIRKPSEPFEWWDGAYQHPPNRPNDRETVVAFRTAWPIPDYLRWRSDGEVTERWHHEKRKGSPPSRPKMTTVPLKQFGRPAPPPVAK